MRREKLHQRAELLRRLRDVGAQRRECGCAVQALGLRAFEPSVLDRRKATYLGDDLAYNAQLYGRWNLLTRALKSGKPQNAVVVKGNFPALYADPAALEAFARGMSTAALSAGAAIAEKFPWPRYRTVADIGSARGVLLAEVASAHSHLSGSGFDLPPMKPLFDSSLRSAVVVRCCMVDPLPTTWGR